MISGPLQRRHNERDGVLNHRHHDGLLNRLFRRISKKTSKVTVWNNAWLSSIAWWRHQIKTFSALLAICTGNWPLPGELPAQRPVTRSFDVFFDLRPNKRLSKEWWGWWFEKPSWPLWRQCSWARRNNPQWNFPQNIGHFVQAPMC